MEYEMEKLKTTPIKKAISNHDRALLTAELRMSLQTYMQMLLQEGVTCGHTTAKAERDFKKACDELITMSLLNKSATMFEMVG